MLLESDSVVQYVVEFITVNGGGYLDFIVEFPEGEFFVGREVFRIFVGL